VDTKSAPNYWIGAFLFHGGLFVAKDLKGEKTQYPIFNFIHSFFVGVACIKQSLLQDFSL